MLSYRFMFAKSYDFRVIESRFITPNIFYVRFRTYKPIQFKAGQFLSLVVPIGDDKVKRLYSFACSPEQGHKNGYELCIRYQPGGKGSEFVVKLKPGDSFKAFGAYGEFTYRPNQGKAVCFISTSTGFAPIRSILNSDAFLKNKPEKYLNLLGVRTEDEILFSKEMTGSENVVAVSRPTDNWNGFKGRVTDFLETMEKTWDWKHCDFYICGNAEMVQEVCRLLANRYGVPKSSIIAENFGVPSKKAQVMQLPNKKSAAVPARLTSKKVA